jgi:hypothetical protein
MHRVGVNKATWNPEKMTTDSNEVNAHIKPTFREGWNFPNK